MSGVQIRCKIREEKWTIRVTWAGVKNGMDPLPHNNLTLAAGHDAEAIFTEPLWGGEAHKILIAVLLFLLINRIKVFMLVPKEVLALLQRVQADYLNPVGGGGGVTRGCGTLMNECLALANKEWCEWLPFSDMASGALLIFYTLKPRMFGIPVYAPCL